MLGLPGVGFRPSRTKHNVDFIVLSDWIEGNVIIGGETISKSDVVDVLCESNVYDDQDFASEIVEIAWTELERRCQWLGRGNSMRMLGREILPMFGSWQDVPAHAFYLALTFAKYYPGWAGQFGTDYTEQGNLFESLAAASLIALGWTVHQTGWSVAAQTRDPAEQAKVIDTIIHAVADRLNERTGNIGRWRQEAANDAGLDLVCYKPFVDGRGGKPIYLIQCASGIKWERKLDTPRIQIWNKLIDFSNVPQKGFAMPFSLEDEAFRFNCNIVEGMFLDRYRLLSAGHTGHDWVPNELKGRLVDWLLPRIAVLPSINS